MKLQNNMGIKLLEDLITSQENIKTKDNSHHNFHIHKESILFDIFSHIIL